jgi:hypothetical protein
MVEPIHGRSLPNRIILAIAGLLAFTLIFVIACRLAVMQMFSGIEQSKASGLSSVTWDLNSMWSTGHSFYESMAVDKASASQAWVSRSAELRMRTSSFEQSSKSLAQIATTHQGFLESLSTESHSGRGRGLSAVV